MAKQQIVDTSNSTASLLNNPSNAGTSSGVMPEIELQKFCETKFHDLFS